MSLRFGSIACAVAGVIALSIVGSLPVFAEEAIVGTWELTSEWEEGDEKAMHLLVLNSDLTGSLKDMDKGGTSELQNVKAKGDALSFSYFYDKSGEFEIAFEGTVVGKELKGEFSIYGATAVVVGTKLSKAEAAAAASRKTFVDQYEARSFTSSEGDTLPYRLFIPQYYDAGKQYPIVLFHHGGGGTGSDNLGNLESALVREWIKPEAQAKNPCFIVAPQIPGKKSESVKAGYKVMKLHTRTIHEILDGLEKEFSIDTTREYVTGLSFGGECVWMSLIERPDRFAATVPICATDGIAVASDDDDRGTLFAQLPVWIFHGDADDTVPVETSQRMVKALKDAGGNPKYTEYPGVDHNSWDRAYRETELIEWLFAQSR